MANKKRVYPPKSFWTLFTVSLVLAVWFVVAINRKTELEYQKYEASYPKTAAFAFDKHKFVRDGQVLDVTVSTQSANATFTRGAAVLNQDSEGSGEFFYIAGAAATTTKVSYSEPVLLGDRIKVQTLTVDQPTKQNNGVITVMYLDRAPNQPMTIAPTLPVTKKFAFQNDGNLIELLP
jgi:hypothetical protein